MGRTKRILLLCSLILSSGCLAEGKARELYDRGLGEKSVPKLLSALRDMANKGDAQAQALLGWEYYQPRYNTTSDIQEALKWFTLVAKQGEGEALLALGQIYYSGEQVRVDYAKAYSFFNQAAQHGEKAAWSNLGLMYANGQYVEADCTKAKEYLDKGEHIFTGPEDFLSACQKDMVDRKMSSATLPVLKLQRVYMFLADENDDFTCRYGFSVSTNKLGEVANLRVTLGIKNNASKEITQTLGFEHFGMNRMDINFTDYIRSSSSSDAELIIYQPEFCSAVKLRVTAASATLNGKDIDLLKTGILTLAP